MSVMDDPAVFIGARLAEDRARANKMEHYTEESETYSCPGSRTEPLGNLEYGEEHCWCGLAERKTRALSEVVAKWAILGEHARGEDGNCITCVTRNSDHPGVQDLWVAVPYPCQTVRLLAAIRSDHADWRPDWAPVKAARSA